MAFCEEEIAALEATNEDENFDQLVEYRKVADSKIACLQGSRQNIYNKLAANILNKLPWLLKYLELKVSGKQRDHIDEIRRGLSDSFAIAALSSRAYIYCAFLAPMVRLCHSLSVDRLMVGQIFKCAREWIVRLELVDENGAMEDAPQLQDLAEAIICSFNELKRRYKYILLITMLQITVNTYVCVYFVCFRQLRLLVA